MDGFLKIDEKKLEALSKKAQSTVTCFYVPFGAVKGQPDNEPTFFAQQKLIVNNSRQPFRVQHETFIVNCLTEKNESVYENLHAHPLIKQNETFSTPTEDQLSIELIVIESVSMSQLRRKMPATLDYVTDKMKMVMFPS